MRGMTPKEYCHVLEFIQKHHRFGYVKKEDRMQLRGEDHFLFIKYVDAITTCYDSREADIWNIILRQGKEGIVFSTNHFNAINPAPPHFKFDNLFDWVMAFLKGEWSNNNILKTMVKEQK
jgi:hypothetical protein